jgi:hypothetical protein
MHDKKALNFILYIPFTYVYHKKWGGGGRGVQRNVYMCHAPTYSRNGEEMNDIERGEFSFPWKISRKSNSISGEENKLHRFPQNLYLHAP